ncbi:MAG: cell division protein ZipA [Cellvibrionaceae bacterium]
MREWLTVIIVLLIITVILDGLRRMRANRKSSLKMSLSMHQGTTKDDLDDYGSELPNGGARVIDHRDENHAEDFNKTLREQKASKRKIKKPYRIPQQVSLSLDEHVPMLMESVEETDSVQSKSPKSLFAESGESTEPDQVSKKSPLKPAIKKTSQQSKSKTKHQPKKPTEPDLYNDLGMFDDGDRVEPKISFESEDGGDNKNTKNDLAFHENSAHKEASMSEALDGLSDELEDVLMSNSTYDSSNVHEDDEMDVLREELRSERDQKVLEEKLTNELVDLESGLKTKTAGASSLFEKDETSREDISGKNLDALEDIDTHSYEDEESDYVDDGFDDEENYSEPEDVLVINVMAAKGERFKGEELLNVVLSQGMRFGTMNIFHHHEDSENDGCILYSMANLVTPGTFDLNAMHEFSTPGVSLFMPLPLDSDSLAAFEKMVATARAIAIQLYGDLKDENRSVFTKQTVEHYRSRIQEFERKHRLKSPA